ncbi:hypothetical protein ACH3VR_02370 [Microbacterium sp. B2969]|uniref:Uncharacterized protein n=1 Tax=Microbacterium alkaliflavum TaxID=3248839 RepID=A0ABW7Q304_9MICO
MHTLVEPPPVQPQAALQTPRRRRWLVPAGVLAIVAVVLFVLAFALNPPIAVTGIVLVALFYTAMLVCAVAVERPHMRNVAFAWLVGGMAVASGLLLLFILAIEQIS